MLLVPPPSYSLPYLYYRRFRALASLASGILSLPFLIIANVIPSLRPDPALSRRRTVILGVVRWFVAFANNYRDVFTAFPTRELVQARLDELGTRYEEAPALQSPLKGEVAKAAKSRGIESVNVPLFWGGKPGHVQSSDKRDARVLLSFHGGGYTANSAHPDDACTFAPLTVTKFSRTVDIFCAVDYRLSALPVGARKSINPYPAALIDGITAVKHVMSLGYQPGNLYLLGDSAGGNLVLAICRYLLYEDDTRLGGLILLSPWADISASHSKPGLSRITHKKTDYLGEDVERASYHYTAFLGGPDDLASPDTPYISPAGLNIDPPSFEGFPRTFINAGGNEQFVDEIKTLHGRMSKYLSPDDLVLDITPHAPHNFYVFNDWEPERTDVMKRIAQWIDSVPQSCSVL